MQPYKINIRPTEHYLRDHADVPWDLIIKTVLSPTKTHPNKRHGKNRITYIKAFDEFIIEIHAELDTVENVLYIINAFRNSR